MVSRYVPAGDVEINGVRRTLLAARVVHDVDAFVATATISLLVDDGVPTPGDRVRVRAGFAPTGGLLFTGEIDTEGVTLAPNDLEVTCSGYLARTRDPIGQSPDIVATLSGDTSDQEPIVTYEAQTASAIIGDILDRYGITQYDLDDSGVLWGELEPIGMMPNDPGEALIKALDEDEFYRTCDSPDGTVRRIPWLRVPSANVARSWVEGTDLYAGRLERSRLGVRNRVIATGLPQKGTTGVAFVPTGIAQASSEFVPTPPEYRALTHNSVLLEDGDKCNQWAATKLGETNRLGSDLPVDLLVGDPGLFVGMTVSVTSAKLGVSAGDRFLVRRVEHIYDDTGFNTSAVLYLTSEGSGYNPNLAPIALIDLKCHLEYLADGSAQYEIALDGSASYDPELGVAGIVSYEWDGDPVVPVPHGTGMTATVKYATSIPTGATVTLTVTDNLGRTGTLTVPVDATAIPVTVRDLIAALGIKLEVSRDGQQSWTEVKIGGASIAAVGTCEIGSDLYTFAWDSSGKLYKVLADNSATDNTPSGANVTACWIGADLHGAANGRVWAGCNNGDVWYSPDHGVTWEARAAAPNAASVTHISESPYQDGDLTLCAGNTAYRSFSSAAGWDVIYTHPNTGLIASRFASGFAQGWIGFKGAAGGDGGASRLRERDNAVALGLPGGGYPDLAIVGLCFDVFEQRLYIADNEASDSYHGRLWVANAATSGNIVNKPYDYLSYGPLRHIIRDGGMAGLVYLAAQNNLLKSVDGFESVQNMRNLTGGRSGYMIGYGAEHAPVVVTVAGGLIFLARLTTECHLIALTESGWEDRGDVGMSGAHGETNEYHRLIRLASGTLLAWHFPRGGVGSFGVRRSTDDGATWADVASLSDALDICQSGDGVIYCYGNRFNGSGGIRARVLRSADDGATFTSVADYLFNDGAVAANVRLDVDPGNSQRLVLMHINGPKVSTDGGATFGAAPYGGGIMGGNGDADWPVVIVSSNHYTYSHASNGVSGGTIVPFTNGVIGPAYSTIATYWRSGSYAYGVSRGGATPIRTTDGGTSWETFTAAAGAVAVVRDAANGDIYLLKQAHTGTGTGGDPYLGSIVRLVGGGSPEDLTQSLFTDLGDLWIPYAGGSAAL